MAREVRRLSARKVATLAEAGRHADGGGLYLSLGNTGRRRWVFLFRWQGKPTEMGLGSARVVSLSRARELANEARQSLAEGVNPLTSRRGRNAVPTFGDFADTLLKSISSGFRNEKHIAQWKMTLTEYARPLRSKPVSDVTTEDVLGVLRPIWQTKSETASRLRGRIERVLDAARAQGYRVGDNPARWRGHLEALLPSRQKLTRGHHAAMPYVQVPLFVRRLRDRRSNAGYALEFTILPAARTGEVLGARWSEIDLPNALWIVPGSRMKAGREHRVPLSPRAMAILHDLERLRRGPADFVFPGQINGRGLSVMALQMLLRRMNVAGVTVHGFRSAFRDFAAEETSVSREIAEAALAHTVGDQTERAYRRGDALEKRRLLMRTWDEFLNSDDPIGTKAEFDEARRHG